MKLGFRERLRVIIFEAETPAGRAFDVVLIVAILSSVTAVMLESVAGIRAEYGGMLYGLEWAFTILFTIEYVLRLYCVKKPLKYATSFFGVVDLLAILPTYLDLLFPSAHFISVIRILRVLRVFRVLKLVQYVRESTLLVRALYASRRKITVFLFSLLAMMVILGSIMYVIEDAEAGFSSIPQSIYWAIVTMTTVGYGDVSPATPLGKAVASFVMVLGYSIIAVPTGIVTAEIARAVGGGSASTQGCPACGREGHDADASHCKHCGAPLHDLAIPS